MGTSALPLVWLALSLNVQEPPLSSSLSRWDFTLSPAGIERVNHADRLRMRFKDEAPTTLRRRAGTEWKASDSTLVAAGSGRDARDILLSLEVPKGTRTVRGLLLGTLVGTAFGISPLGAKVFHHIYGYDTNNYAGLEKAFGFWAASVAVGGVTGGIVGSHCLAWERVR